MTELLLQKGLYVDLNFAIKLYHLHNAMGCCAKPIFIIADSSKSESYLLYFRTDGLGSTTGSEAGGWLVFTKPRACNHSFYRWFGKDIVVNFIESCK